MIYRLNGLRVIREKDILNIDAIWYDITIQRNKRDTAQYHAAGDDPRGVPRTPYVFAGRLSDQGARFKRRFPDLLQT